MTMCLLSLTILKPAFSNARTSWRWGTPGRRGTLHGHFDFSYLGTASLLIDNGEILLDG
jgi:hypothetical protein